MRLALMLAGLILAAPVAGSARPLPAPRPLVSGDGALCMAAVDIAEKAARLPPRMLNAISLVEAGRPDPQSGIGIAWPWTINVAGSGHFFASKAEAIAAVQTAQQSGIQSIDVGCTQINLMHHPRAFANLDEAFDPVSNARYAATFLLQLHGQTASWGAAVQAYHSYTPELGYAYGQLVANIWPQAATYGLQKGPPSDIRIAALPAPIVVDPYHVMTPAFRSLMVQQASFRKLRDAAMGLTPVSPSGRLLSTRSHIRLPGDTRHETLRASARD